MIDKKIIKEYCDEFNGRYLTLKKLKTLNERDRRFHLFGHWNILHSDNSFLYHSYYNGGTGEIEKLFSKISFLEIDDVVFVRWENVFILFKYHPKTGMKPIYLKPMISTFGTITKQHEFYNRHDITVLKQVLNFDMSTSKAYHYYDAFTLKPIVR